jgi:hypothetical protein
VICCGIQGTTETIKVNQIELRISDCGEVHGVWERLSGIIPNQTKLGGESEGIPPVERVSGGKRGKALPGRRYSETGSE